MAAFRSKRGRRPIVPNPETAAHVHVKISADLYDQVYQRATAARVSVPEFLRQTVARALATP